MTDRRNFWLAVLALVLVLAFALLVYPEPASARAGIDWEEFDLVANDGTTVRADFGTMSVPERRDDPDSAMIQLAMVRLPSKAGSPGLPIVFLADGPGQSGIETARGGDFAAFMRLRDVADVIVLDQRGTGRSRPNLDCTQRLSVGAGKELTPNEFAEAHRKPIRECVAFWESRGVHLAGYTTLESADDIEAIRDALGVDRINLWGLGYGTHLALAVMRRHPGSVERAVLHGVVGPDDTHKLPKSIYSSLRQLGKLAAKDPVIGADAPDLVGTMERLTNQLAGAPERVFATDPFTGRDKRVVVDAFVLSALAATVVGNTESYPFVPLAVISADRNGFDTTFGEAALEVRGDSVGSLMTWAMLCASGVSDRRAGKIAKQEDDFFTGRIVDLPFPEVCDEIPVPDLGNAFRSRVQSDVPTLLVSGTLDGRTPRANAKVAGKGLSEATELKLVRGGHNDLLSGDAAIAEAVASFFQSGSAGTRRITLPSVIFEPVS